MTIFEVDVGPEYSRGDGGILVMELNADEIDCFAILIAGVKTMNLPRDIEENCDELISKAVGASARDPLGRTQHSERRLRIVGNEAAVGVAACLASAAVVPILESTGIHPRTLSDIAALRVEAHECCQDGQLLAKVLRGCRSIETSNVAFRRHPSIPWGLGRAWPD